MLTKEKLIRIRKNRGYKVKILGNMVVTELEDDREICRDVWFFNPDGSVDENNPPTWRLIRK